MKNTFHIIAFFFKNIFFKGNRGMCVSPSTLGKGLSMVLCFVALLMPQFVFGQAAASFNYATQTGNLGSTYSWINCSSGTTIVSGDGEQAQINWPFEFSFYDNDYTTSDLLSVCTNGFIRLDGVASTDADVAINYDLTSTATDLGQVIALAVYDDKVGDNSGWVRTLTTGTSPNQIFTIEYNNLEIDYNDNKYADVQVSFYESENKIVLKLGTELIVKKGVDMGIHSGVATYFNKWQELKLATNDTWIEYVPQYIEVNATVGTDTAYYGSLKAAFDEINDGTHQGDITVKVNHSTTETASAELKASGSGSASYSSVNIYPTKTGLSISGDVGSSIVDLYGADNVTIDGSVGASGSDASLTISNSNTYKYAYTIRLRQSAERNIVRHCYLKASSLGYGVVRFEGSNSGDGCNNNIIEYCNITNSGGRLIRAIYSSGSDGRENSDNIIRYNNIYDFLNPSETSYGISIGWKSTGWIIEGNSFYETTTLTPEGDNRYYPIQVGSGDNHRVRGNYIGGSAPECGGSPFTMEAMVPYYFCAIYMSVDNVGYIEDNVISNIKCVNSEDNPWDGLYLNSGSIDVTGNTIGAGTGNSSIVISTPVAVATATIDGGVVTALTLLDGGSGYSDTDPPTVKFASATVTATATTTVVGGVITELILTSGGSGYSSEPKVTFDGQSNYSTSHGIIQNSKGTVNITGNTIGSITTVGSDYYTHGFETVYVRSGPSITTMSNNVIGSETTANSIHTSSTAVYSAIKQDLYGLYSSNTGATTISGNIIANLTNAYQAGNSGSYCRGIRTTEGTNSILNNTVRDMSIAGGAGTSLIGIHQNSDEAGQILSGNEVYNLSNLTSEAIEVDICGIYFSGPTSGTNVIDGNFVHDISITSTNIRSSMMGMYLYGGYSTCSNNIITIGNSSLGYSVFGIWDDRGLNDIYFNTIYIGGAVSSGETRNTAALYNNYNYSARNYRNNVFLNARSGGTSGNHYAIYYYKTGGTFTTDYNAYYVSGTGGILGYYNGEQTTLDALKTATSQDASSLNVDPGFATAGGSEANDYVTSASLPGVAIAGITTTYNGITRSDPPKMGALEVSPGFTWQGTTSADFATASNWTGGAVPPNGADIVFAATPTNDCYLDQNRTLNNITNTSGKKLVLNGHQLNLTGNLVSPTANQIKASAASSGIIFAGTEAQSISSGIFVSNTIDSLELNNEYGLTQNGDVIVSSALVLTNGAYSIGDNTLTLNGEIVTTSGSLTGGSSSNITLAGSGSSTTLPGVFLNDLTLNRTSGVSLGGDVSVAGTLALTAGTLTVGSHALTISGDTPTLVSGSVDASNALAGVNLFNTSGIILPVSFFGGSVNNLYINGGGITVEENLTVNGVLDLQTANPSATKGLLDITDPNELIMGVDAINYGGGDVTGIITRNTIIANKIFTFGNKNTYLTFYSGATNLPVYMKLKVVIGIDPWGTGTVKRVYELIQKDGHNYLGTFRAFYLDSELDGHVEDELSFWSATTPFTTQADVARTNNSTTENWVEISDFDLAYLPDSFGEFQMSIDESDLSYQTWTGRISDDWNESKNWADAPFDGIVPDATSFVIIPDASTTDNDPTLPPGVTTEIRTISLKAGSILNSGSSDDAQLSLNHNVGTWNNAGGTFNPGNSTVNFKYAGNSTISGTTSFNNINIPESSSVTLTSGTYIKVAGEISILNLGELRARVTGKTIIEYNGVNQTIIIPGGVISQSGYSKLILSGSGTKTMSATAMVISDELEIAGTASVTAGAALTIGADLIILDDATFSTGAFDHSIGGSFDNSGNFIASSGSSITLNGTSLQNVYGDSSSTFENLIINNSAGVDIYTDATINDELTLTNGNLNVGSTTLTINGEVNKTSGFLNVTSLSSLSFGGTTALTLASDVFSTTPSIDNLTINRSGGVIFGSDLTINGELNLEGANPTSGIIGALDIGTDTLFMGATATTIGVGDVTGIVKRTTILPHIEYTFGHQFSSIMFENVGTLPTEVSLKISIGAAPTWKTDGIKRIYDISQIGGSETKVLLRTHYLDNELNGNNAASLSYFGYIVSSSTLLDRGLSEINTSENWILLNNVNFSNLPPVFGAIEHGLGVSATNVITWDGSESTDWDDPDNWTPAFSPDSTKIVIIPDSTTYAPLIPATDSISTLLIQSGGILNASSNTELSIFGAGGAWVNNGMFNASTSKVIFMHGDILDVVTVAGITNFYDIHIGESTILAPVAGATFRIAGTATGTSTSQAYWSSINSTVEWNGVDQNINNPQGIGGHSGYYNLILSGSGTKTMPTTAMVIAGDFSTAGTATVAAASYLVIGGDLTIGAGTSFGTGTKSSSLAGDFENNGTFNDGTGGNVIFNDTLSVQTIGGIATINFDDLTINNAFGVSQESDIKVNNALTLTNGFLSVEAHNLAINGTISNPSGYIDLSSTSNLSFGGADAMILNNDLFNGNDTLNNLSINRAGGITLGNEDITVDGTLALTSGTLTLAANALALAGTAPIRTNGTLDASHASATIAFDNSSAMILPSSLFSGNVNNMTILGAGGVSSSDDISLNKVLSLQSNNPSSTKGSLDMGTDTLHMGAEATTSGMGDVTGLVKRKHTFGNGIDYSFGNQYTTLNFLNVADNIKPTWVICKIEIGAAPSWRSEAINRFYSFAQSGGNDRIIVKLHYLDSELHGTETDEKELVFWDAYNSDLVTYNSFTDTFPRNHNGTDEVNNWVQLTGPAIDYLATSAILDVKQWSLAYANVTTHKWIGLGSASYPGDWSLPGHWQGGVPQSEDTVLIPNILPVGTSGYPYRNLLPVIAPASAISIEIEAGATLTSDGFDITVSGYGEAWVNNGTFIPGTGTVIFNHGDEEEVVVLKGTTDFYNLTIADKTNLEAATNSITRIAGALSEYSRSILDFTSNENTVVYNGSDVQSILNPTGGPLSGFYHLTFSDDGTKTLPSTLNVLGDFTINANIQAADNTTVMMGTTLQTIIGTHAATFNNFSIDNAAGVLLNLDQLCTVSGILQINSGKKLEVAAGKQLTVSGTISNEAGESGLILKSSATSTASLIHQTPNVSATVERYISGDAEDWHFLSTPVADQAVGGEWLPTGTYGNGSGYDLYLWNEPTNCWIYQRDSSNIVNWATAHTSDNFVAGRGYLYSVQATTPTKEFAGILNNGDVTYALTIGSSVDTLQGFNLVGNPYPSSIDWMAASGWSRDMLKADVSGYDMWIWNPAAGNYGVCNSSTGDGTNSVTRYIAPMQGFFVRAASAGNMVSTNDVRIHDATTVWKSASIDLNRISAVVHSQSDETSDEVRLSFGYSENNAGATKLFSPLATAPSLYLPFGNDNLTIRYLSDTDSNSEVPLSFKVGRDGDYTLNFDFKNAEFQIVILEDKLTHEFVDLTATSNYGFEASIKDNENRFVIHFKAIEIPEKLESLVNIYSTGSSVIIDLLLVTKESTVTVYDVMGKRLLKETLIGETKYIFPFNIDSQMLIVYLENGNGHIAKKIMLKK